MWTNFCKESRAHQQFFAKARPHEYSIGTSEYRKKRKLRTDRENWQKPLKKHLLMQVSTQRPSGASRSWQLKLLQIFENSEQHKPKSAQAFRKNGEFLQTMETNLQFIEYLKTITYVNKSIPRSFSRTAKFHSVETAQKIWNFHEWRFQFVFENNTPKQHRARARICSIFAQS